MSRCKIFLLSKDLCDCFKPLLYTGNMFSLPYRVAKDNTLKISKSLTWLNIMLSCTSLILFDLQQFVLRNDLVIENAFQMLGLSRIIKFNLLTLIYILQNSLSHKGFIKICSKFQKLEKLYGLSEKDIKEIYIISILEGILFGLGFLMSAIYISLKDVTVVSKMLYGIGFSIWISTVATMEANFANLVALTEKFVTLTHKSLKNILKMNYNKSYNFQEEKNHKLDTIIKMRQGYRQILKIKNDINYLYSFRMLSTIAYSLFEIVFLGFLIVVALQLREILSESKFMFFIMFTAYMIGKLCIIIIVCDRLTSKFKKTGEIVCDLLAKSQEREVKKELKLFALELLHRNPSITANGFFNIDYTLIYNIIGAVFMYLIILFQFKFDELQQTKQNQSSPVEYLTYFGM